MQFTANSFTLNVGVLNFAKGNLQKEETQNNNISKLQCNMPITGCMLVIVIVQNYKESNVSLSDHHVSFPSYNITEVKQHCYKLFKPNNTFPTPEQKTIYSDMSKMKGKRNIKCLSKRLGHHPAARTASVHLGFYSPSLRTL